MCSSLYSELCQLDDEILVRFLHIVSNLEEYPSTIKKHIERFPSTQSNIHYLEYWWKCRARSRYTGMVEDGTYVTVFRIGWDLIPWELQWKAKSWSRENPRCNAFSSSRYLYAWLELYYMRLLCLMTSKAFERGDTNLTNVVLRLYPAIRRRCIFHCIQVGLNDR